MSHRTKSGQKRTRRAHQQALKRRIKRKKAALIAAGVIKKGIAPLPKQTA